MYTFIFNYLNQTSVVSKKYLIIIYNISLYFFYILDHYIFPLTKHITLYSLAVYMCPFVLRRLQLLHRGRRDRMVVGFITTYATNAYHH